MTSTSERSALDAAMDFVTQKMELRVIAKWRYDHATGNWSITDRQLEKATSELRNAVSLYNQELLRCVQHGGLVP